MNNFVIRIKRAQGTSWQGVVYWTDKKTSKKFRSTLELIRLIDSALLTDSEESFCKTESLKHHTDEGEKPL